MGLATNCHCCGVLIFEGIYCNACIDADCASKGEECRKTMSNPRMVRTYKITVARDLYVEAESAHEAITAVINDYPKDSICRFSMECSVGNEPRFCVDPKTKELISL